MKYQFIYRTKKQMNFVFFNSLTIYKEIVKVPSPKFDHIFLHLNFWFPLYFLISFNILKD